MHEAPVDEDDLHQVLDQARSDLLALAGARLFITGGTGYIGRWLLEALAYANRHLDLDLRATVLSRHPGAFAWASGDLVAGNWLDWVAGDVRDFPFPDGPFTHAIHAATDVIATHSPLHTYEVTTAGTRRVLDLCRERGARDVLLLSSGAVYGAVPPPLERVPEDHPCRPDLSAPQAAYGVGKLVSEWLGSAYSDAYGLSCKSARVFAQVGPRIPLDKQFAVGNFVRDALRRAPFVIQGDGTPRRSYLYASDLVVWLLAILVRGQGGQAYNVGSDQDLSILELAQRVAKVAGVERPDIQILSQPSPDRPHQWYVPDISRARHELGLDIHIPLDDALARTIAWCRRCMTPGADRP